MPLDVYLLVGHRQLQSDQAEEQVFLKLPNLDQERQKHLAEVYRQLPDPLRLVLLLSIYDELEDDEIAQLLRCSARKIRHLLQLAGGIFADACGETVSRESIALMLESETDSMEISKEVIDRVREMLRDSLFGDERE